MTALGTSTSKSGNSLTNNTAGLVTAAVVAASVFPQLSELLCKLTLPPCTSVQAVHNSSTGLAAAAIAALAADSKG